MRWVCGIISPVHELSVTQSILDIALAHAQRAGASHITRINLVLGEMSGIVDDSVQFYFDFISEGTIAEGAELAFERVPARFRCRTCDITYSADGLDWRCPQCGEIQLEVLAGREFRLDSIEVT